MDFCVSLSAVFHEILIIIVVFIHHAKRRNMSKQRTTWTVVAYQETWMQKVPEIKERVQEQAPREVKLGDSLLRLCLGPQARHTRENEFLLRHTTKKATIHVGYAEGKVYSIFSVH